MEYMSSNLLSGENSVHWLKVEKPLGQVFLQYQIKISTSNCGFERCWISNKNFENKYVALVAVEYLIKSLTTNTVFLRARKQWFRL